MIYFAIYRTYKCHSAFPSGQYLSLFCLINIINRIFL